MSCCELEDNNVNVKEPLKYSEETITYNIVQ